MSWDCGVCDDEDGFLDVVEDDDLVVDAEEEVGEVAIVWRGVVEFFGFEVADSVVGGVSDGPADEGGEVGEFDALDGGEEGFEFGEGVGGFEVHPGYPPPRRGYMLDGDLVADGFDGGGGAACEE